MHSGADEGAWSLSPSKRAWTFQSPNLLFPASSAGSIVSLHAPFAFVVTVRSNVRPGGVNPLGVVYLTLIVAFANPGWSWPVIVKGCSRDTRRRPKGTPA